MLLYFTSSVIFYYISVFCVEKLNFCDGMAEEGIIIKVL